MRINGKRVVDATVPLPVHVTMADVRKGNTKDPGGCAAAQALMRECGFSQARVHLGRVYVEKPDRWVRFMTPESLSREIVAYDRKGKAFEPGEYRLRPPPPTAKLGARYRAPGTHGKRTGKRRVHIARVRHVTENVRQRGANR